MKKNILSVFIAGIILISSIPSFALEDTYFEEREIVESLTYVDLSDTLGDLSRAQFCRAVYNIQNNDEPSATAFVFSDVDINSAYAGYIQYLYEMGIVSGDGMGNFYPDDKIRVCEAFSILLTMSGYGDIIKGSYPQKIMEEAQKSGLTENVPGSALTNVTGKMAYYMIYNLLYTDVAEYVFGNKGYYQKTGKFMEKILNIYEDKGIVESVAGISSAENILNTDIAVIGDIELRNNSVIGAENIGLYGKYYYRKDSHGDYELLYFVPKNNKIIKVLAADIENYSDNVYTYTEGNKIKTIKLEKGKDVLYNSVQAKDESHMKPEYGYVKLIDNNGNGKYDVVLIFEYRSFFVNYVNYNSENIIYIASGEDGNRKREFSLKNKEYKIFNEKGQKIELNELLSNSVITVLESDEEIVIYQNDEIQTGNITAIRDSKYITVNDTEYFLIPDLYTDDWNKKDLTEVEIHIDMFGNVAAVRTVNNLKWQFAYVISTHFEEKLNNIIQFKLLLSDGNVKILSSDKKKFKLNGVNVSASQTVTDSILSDQVIRIKLNRDENIIAVDTPFDISGFNLEYTAKNEDDCLLRRCDGLLMYKYNTKMFKKVGDMTLRGEAYIDKDTVVFNVPGNRENAEDDDYYTVTSPASNATGRTVSYNTDSTSISSEAVIFYNDSDGKVSENSRSMLVKGIKHGIRNDNDAIIVKGFYNGQETEKYVDEDIYDVCAKLQRGDFIRIFLKNDIITDVEPLYMTDGSGKLNQNYWTGTSTSPNAQIRFLIGNAELVEENRMLLRFNNGLEDKFEIFRPESFLIYVYDPNLSKDECVYVGTPGDIVDKNMDSEFYDTLIVGTRETISHDMLIVKKKR